ncbi:hypothetical protein HD595_005525 [Nonomuraea roseoviolacea subsp. carminata]|uniref:Uncharacterized protein n=1 Tax=Nonomuraea roseoviolacea subsp. carminata TaxID=160689 RepID=A0ABT1K5W3_9ACTN|nr:hypothetical protein [Nonomuraea roseoviolacea subsp. carminata]
MTPGHPSQGRDDPSAVRAGDAMPDAPPPKTTPLR